MATWTQRHKSLLALLAAASLVRLALAPLPGYFSDLRLYAAWGALLDRHFFDFYSAGASMVPQPNYPPLTIYVYGLLAWLSRGFAGLAATQPDDPLGGISALNVFMKLPTLAAELGLTAVIYVTVRRTAEERWALLAAAAFAFSPVVLMDGPLWGQLDAAAALGVVAALALALCGRGLAAGIVFGLGLMVKPQPVVFAPLLLVYLWRWQGRREALRALAGMVAAVIVVCLPYLLPPRFEILRFWQDEAHIVAALPNSTLSAFNLWWLLGAQQTRFSDPSLAGLSVNVVGWTLFAVVLGAVLMVIWRDGSPGRLWLGGALLAVAFFALTPLQHERYLYPAVALFALAAVFASRTWLFYALASLTALANMVVIVVNPVVSASGVDLPAWRAHLSEHPEIAGGLAALNLTLLLCVVWVFVCGWSPARAAEPAAGQADLAPGTEDGRQRMAPLGAAPAGTGLREPSPGPDTARGGMQEAEAGERMRRPERLARQAWTWARTSEGQALLALLGLAALVRALMLPYRGFFDDVQALVTWGAFLGGHFLHFYSAGAGLHPTPDYPPLAMYLFGLLDGMYTLGAQVLGRTPVLHVDHSRTLAALFKLPILLADLGLVLLIYLVGRRVTTWRRALLLAGTYAFSPVVLFAGVLWGQIDPLFVLAVAVALVLALRGQGLAAGIALGLAVMIKPQPVIYIPLLLLYLWRWQGGREALRGLAGMIGTGFVVSLPYLLPPRPEVLAFQQDLARWERIVPYTSVSGFNLWWLVGAQRVPYTLAVLGPFSPNVLGWALFFVVLGLVLWGTWRSDAPGRLWFGAGLLTVAFFIFTPLQHERYIMPAVAFFALGALYSRASLVFYVLTTVAATLNVILVVISPVFSDSKLPYAYTIGRHFLRAHPQVFTILSAANVLLLAALLAIYLREVLAVHAGQLRPAPALAGSGLAGSGPPSPGLVRRMGGGSGEVDTSELTQREPGVAEAEGPQSITTRSLSIVLPAYNEEAVIATTVRACLRTADRCCPNAEVIVVDDGSRDQTGAIADRLAATDPRVVAVHHERNKGYGATLLTGFARAHGELLFFMDSDGQFDIEDLPTLLRVEAERPGTAVLGYRERRCDALPRKLNAWGWKQVVRLTLGLRGVRDIDCAFKLLPASQVRACAVTSEGAMVNTELLLKLQRLGVPMVEVPVRHYPRTHGAATGANLRVIAKAFRELLRLRLRMGAWRPGKVAAEVGGAEVAAASDATGGGPSALA